MGDRESVFADGHVVGYVEDGVFYQRVTERHIFRQLNAKGIDISLYRQLRHRCHTWRLTFKDTRQVLSISFERIGAVGMERDTGAGSQIFVKLQDFDEDKPALQKRLF